MPFLLGLVCGIAVLVIKDTATQVVLVVAAVLFVMLAFFVLVSC